MKPVKNGLKIAEKWLFWPKNDLFWGILSYFLGHFHNYETTYIIN